MRDATLDNTLYFLFNTKAYSSGVPTTLLGTPVVSVYEENNLTQITAGVTLSVDYDGIIGLNQVAIVASSANGYEAGKSYSVAITTGTVNGVSEVGRVVARFTIQASATAHVVSAISNALGATVGSSLNFSNTVDNVVTPIKGVAFIGVETSGTNNSVNSEDGVYHQIDDTANAIDIVYEFDVGGGRTATQVIFRGYLIGSNDSINVQVYNGVSWSTVGNIVGQVGTENITREYPLLVSYTGSGADLGKVFVRFVCSAQSNPTLYVDRLLVQALNIGQSVGYANGQIWIDTLGSNTNTEDFVDGTADNPVSTIAAASTLSSSIGLKNFKLAADSNITLTQTYNDYVFEGHNWSVVLNNQDISGSKFSGAANGITGTGTGTTPAFFYECSIGNATLLPSAFQTCGLSGTLTIGSAGDFFLVDCFSQVPGANAPIINMGIAIGATNISIRRWSGGLTINNLSLGDIVSLDGIFGTVTLNGADAQVEIRGIAKNVINNLTGSPTVNDNTLRPSTIASAVTSDMDLNSVKLDGAYSGGIGIGTAGDGLTSIPWNAAWDAQVESEVTDAMVSIGLDHLVNTAVTGTDVTDNSIIAKIVSKSGTADWDTFNNTTDSLEASRDKLTDIETDTAQIGSAGVGLTNIPWNSSWDAEVQSECADALNAYDPPTKAEMDVLLTTQLTESYAANGVTPSLTQAVLAIHQMLMDYTITGTNVDVKRLNSATTAFIATLNDPSNPTGITR